MMEFAPTNPEEDADNRRRHAWEIAMSGGYQTLGDDDRHRTDFFASFEWGQMEPRPDLTGGALCLAEPGIRYVIYLPDGSQPAPTIFTPGRQHTRWYNPRTGEFAHSPDDNGDWAMLVKELEE